MIEAGAPADEYADEAAQLTAAIENLARAEISKEIILALISAIWLKSFELSEEIRITVIDTIDGTSQHAAKTVWNKDIL